MYKAKTLFTGFQIGLNTKDLFVGVPSKYQGATGRVEVEHNKEIRSFGPEKIVESREFDDKFSPGTYTLNYYLWKKR